MPKSLTYTQITSDIEVRVEPFYLGDHSNPRLSQFVWAYNIVIQNRGKRRVQLMNRHWRIIDGQGRVQEVHGAGVVGEQPVLNPGEMFSYSSHTVLPTETGFMGGTYDMLAENGHHMKVNIPNFSLDLPRVQHTLN